MALYVLRRFLQAIPALFGVSVVSFLLLHIVPGTPVQAMLGTHYTAARAAALANALGLNKPLIVQYGIWAWNLLHLNLGYSYQYSVPVWNLIWLNLPHTLELVALAVMLAHLFAIFLGTLQAYYRKSAFDHVFTVIFYLFYSMPSFWLGIIMIQVFAIYLGWFPTGGISNPLVATPTFWDIIRHLVLPVSCLMLLSVASWSRFMRSSVMDVLELDYTRTARSKGVSEFGVVLFHVLRNSLLPMITLFGLSLPNLIAGALVVEEIFNYPGMGLLFWQAANVRDYPTLLGIVMITGTLTIVGNLIADLLYGVADPRIQYN
jgi:peptide/nickel transport system permease protein